MSYILTFVASSADKPVSAKVLRQAETILDHYNCRPTEKPDTLKKNKATDLHLPEKPQKAALKHIREELADHRIDLFINTRENRQKKLLLADMDSTIVKAETLDELADYAGIKDQIAAITTRAMNGELDFHEALKERVALLKDLDASKLQDTLERMEINPGAKEFIKNMNKSGATCVLVSGGFTFFTEAIANDVGFAHNHGNILDIKNGTLTGTVSPPILDKVSKLNFLNEYSQKFDLTLDQTLTIGDGANDLPMLKAAGLGIGYYPKPAVAEELDNLILYGDFTAALYAQNIPIDT